MTTEPDFTKYTLDELIDARRSIDEVLYSERVKKIEEQIAKRKPAGEFKKDFFHMDLFLRYFSINLLKVVIVVLIVLSLARELLLNPDDPVTNYIIELVWFIFVVVVSVLPFISVSANNFLVGDGELAEKGRSILFYIGCLAVIMCIVSAQRLYVQLFY